MLYRKLKVAVGILVSVLTILIGVAILSYFGFRGWQYYIWSGFQVQYDSQRSKSNQVFNRLEPSHLQQGNRSSESKDVLLVTIDTLRADHLPFYGYPKPTAPFLSSLADSGTVFERAFSTASITTPSHASIFTSLYPKQHGITSNSQALDTSITTLTELLQEQGYSTAGFVSTNVHFGPGNLDQGFDTFDQPKSNQEMVYDPPGSRDRIYLNYRPANRTLERAQNWLSTSSSDSPAFVWIHLFDPHHPLALREQEISRMSYRNRSERANYFNFVESTHHVDLTNGRYSHGKHDNNWLAYYRLYDSEIFYADQSLKRFYDSFTEHRGQPYTVVTADHGEGLANHNYWGHGKHVYNEQVRVPLLVNRPGSSTGRDRVEQIVELNDVKPTILREVGYEWDDLMSAKKYPIEGTPLQSTIYESKGENGSEFGWAFSQRQVFQWTSMQIRFMDFFIETLTNSKNYPFKGRSAANYEPGKGFSLAGPQGKYIHQTRFQDEYYELDKDFYEQKNRIRSDRDSVIILRSTIGDVLEQLNQSTVPDAKHIRNSDKLQSLGYIN